MHLILSQILTYIYHGISSSQTLACSYHGIISNLAYIYHTYHHITSKTRTCIYQGRNIHRQQTNHVIIQSMVYRLAYTCLSKEDKAFITNKCIFMWIHDLTYLPYYISAPMHQWMDMWMHVHGIKARNMRKTLI